MKRWITAEHDAALAERLSRELSVPVPVAALLASRGYGEPRAAERFLNPRLSDVADPSSLPGMAAAVERIAAAVRGGERIVVFGDYDADGITATALMVKVLAALGASVVPFLPHRIDDGYGLAPDTLQRCMELHKPDLVVTVDCGTSAAEAVRAAAALHRDVVITDHHEPGGEIAPAVAVVNPKLGSDEDAKLLAGVGVAFKLCYALLKRLRDEKFPGANAVDLREHFDLVCVGTVADIVPLRGENRILVRHGLGRLSGDPCVGLAALIEVCGIQTDVDAYHVGFQIGPRLNAAGRLGDAEAALELLLTTDASRARDIALQLDRANRERQNIEARIFEEAVSAVDAQFDPARDRVVVVAGRGWHPGVIGIVASRITQKYYRPSVVIALDDETGVGRGSCRSIEGFNLVEHIEQCAELLGSHGGHAMAAGLDIEGRHVQAFREKFNEVASRTLKEEDLIPTLKVDGWISLGDVDQRFYEALERLKPFGVGNRTPIWAARGVHVVGQPRILKDKHLKMTVGSGGRQIEAIGFGLANRELPDGPLDIAFGIRLNDFMGNRKLELQLQDFRPSEIAG